MRIGGALLVASLAGCSDRAPVAAPPAAAERPGWSGASAQAAAPAVTGKIAFTSLRDGNFEVYVMNADGSAQTNLTNSAAVDTVPEWSPDGTLIAFSSSAAAHPDVDVYVMNADGSGQVNVTNHPASDASPVWSPDGSKLAFVSSRDGNAEVYVMSADGSGQTNVTNNPAYDESPAWSPDGNRLAFMSIRDGNAEIYVMNADGSGQTNLTNNSGGDRAVAWSPDGTRLAFSSGRDGNLEVYVMNADGTGQTNITNHPSQDMDPAWQPLPPRYPFAGFFAPVDNPGERDDVVNRAKAGSSIPVKFSLGGDRGLEIFRSGYPKFVSAPCDLTDTQVPIEATTDARAGLTYDAATGQYTYVWKTDKRWAGRCGQLDLGLADGSDHHALFTFVR